MCHYWASKAKDLRVRIEGFWVNADGFAVAVDVGAGDDDPFVAVVAFPNEGFAGRDGHEAFHAYNTASGDTPEASARGALTRYGSKEVDHVSTQGAKVRPEWLGLGRLA